MDGSESRQSPISGTLSLVLCLWVTFGGFNARVNELEQIKNLVYFFQRSSYEGEPDI